MDIYDKYGHGYSYFDLMSCSQEIITGILGFVDDCNLSNTGKKFEILFDVLKHTQHNAQLWNDLDTASDTKLKLSKYFT